MVNLVHKYHGEFEKRHGLTAMVGWCYATLPGLGARENPRRSYRRATKRGEISSKNGSTSNKLQQKQNLLGMIAHVSDNIILKRRNRRFCPRQCKKIVKYFHIYERFSVV